MTYIESEKEKECAFCKALAQTDGPENLIFHRGKRAFAILNRYPYTSGHIMILPFEHHPTLAELDAETRAEMMELTSHATEVLAKLYSPQGFNVGANIGEAAGAGIEEHVHIHVVPRWFGDSNFMSTVGKTRVLPEALEETYEKVRGKW